MHKQFTGRHCYQPSYWREEKFVIGSCKRLRFPPISQPDKQAVEGRKIGELFSH